ncbi:MAG: type II toxin-antitoxin system RelE/ParE family toxin [Acidobacteria bacterium]|nr:type II toxin-antitoxin system RelE/ParE family toxin [Acidobacteriota bacterium]
MGSERAPSSARRRYRVDISKPAARDFDRLDPPVQTRMAEALRALAGDPRPPGCVTLKGARTEPDTWRVREGDWRILYTIEDTTVVVLVIRIRHRREVYRP